MIATLIDIGIGLIVAMLVIVLSVGIGLIALLLMK